ncbi:hypothetical protein GUJ93_ZPchr0006g42847 [Zizania palustris]|uniref:Uncharacterized protein n=1 Tax=Zizania palustris TaxID=103762 RepID=A0A8J5VQC8_ZIZPA|nr:hypothetical protein GUJ93_ZPchr0006g42847 [Zizania palustris]
MAVSSLSFTLATVREMQCDLESQANVLSKIQKGTRANELILKVIHSLRSLACLNAVLMVGCLFFVRKRMDRALKDLEEKQTRVLY